MFKILSIDGGGIRGIIPARILTEIECQTGTPIYRMFDLITGTSTGGILALGLTCPDPDGQQPAHKAEDLLNMYLERGQEIFTPARFPRLRRIANYYSAKYSATGLERVLQCCFKDARLKDALTEVLIPTYEIERRWAFFFKSRKAKMAAKFDYLMRDVARATSAAPTYFPPHRIFTDDISQRFVWVDGGVFANNPTLCGYVDAKKNHGDKTDQMYVLSLGTGEHTTSLQFEETRGWGQIGWAQSVIDISLDGISGTVDYQMHELARRDDSLTYQRLQTRLDKGNDTLDDASPRNTRNLLLVAEKIIRENQDAFNEMCLMLKPHDTAAPHATAQDSVSKSQA